MLVLSIAWRKGLKNQQYMQTKLVISKDKFKSLLSSQIEAGNDLLMREVSRMGYEANPYAFGRQVRRVEYIKEEKDLFFADYKRWDDMNKEILKQSFDSDNNDYRNEYIGIEEHSMFLVTSNTDVVELQKDIIRKENNNLQSIIDRIELIPVDSKKAAEDAKSSPIKETLNINKTKVFVVHGHNGQTKEKVARTLETLGLTPVILHEQPDGGKTIIEKFEKNGTSAGYAIILLTFDDEGKAKDETNLKKRARQNVVFEMGYFIASLGRHNVFLLVDEGIEVPSDIAGVVYTKLDADNAWQIKLVKELKNAGYQVDANKLI